PPLTRGGTDNTNKVTPVTVAKVTFAEKNANSLPNGLKISVQPKDGGVIIAKLVTDSAGKPDTLLITYPRNSGKIVDDLLLAVNGSSAVTSLFAVSATFLTASVDDLANANPAQMSGTIAPLAVSQKSGATASVTVAVPGANNGLVITANNKGTLYNDVKIG